MNAPSNGRGGRHNPHITRAPPGKPEPEGIPPNHVCASPNESTGPPRPARTPPNAAASTASQRLPVSAATLNPKQAPMIMQPSAPRLVTPDRSVTVSPSATYSTDVPERTAPVSTN